MSWLDSHQQSVAHGPDYSSRAHLSLTSRAPVSYLSYLSRPRAPIPVLARLIPQVRTQNAPAVHGDTWFQVLLTVWILSESCLHEQARLFMPRTANLGMRECETGVRTPAMWEGVEEGKETGQNLQYVSANTMSTYSESLSP